MSRGLGTKNAVGRVKNPNAHTCADAGGVNEKGNPCRRKTKPGQKCSAHSDEGLAEMVQAKADILRLYSDGLVSIAKVCQDVGVSRDTFYRWRRIDPDFDAAVKAVQDQVDKIRLDAIESSMFSRIVNGTASGAEVIFWLINRSDGRWKDVRRVEHTGKIFHGLMGAVAALSVHDVERLMAMPEDERREAVRRLVEGE